MQNVQNGDVRREAEPGCRGQRPVEEVTHGAEVVFVVAKGDQASQGLARSDGARER